MTASDKNTPSLTCGFCIRWIKRLIPALLLCGTSYAATLQPLAELDRTRISDGDIVILTLSVPGDLPGEPNLEPLQQDFDLLKQSQSSQTSIINGHLSSKRQWQLQLAPKSAGKLSIPPLYIGNAHTERLSLEVLPTGTQLAEGESPEIFMEVEAVPESPYVQSQVVYKVRIFLRVQPRQLGLSDLSADNTLIERLGEDKSYNTYRNGQRYSVIERTYALFPQSSGQLRLEAPVLSASLPVKNARGSNRMQNFFGRGMGGLFQETRPIRVRGKALELSVLPQPTEVTEHWLPAESLSLEESWSPSKPEFRVGEPVTRTITIHARGLSDSQLPDLAMPLVPGIKTYPDQPQNESKAINGSITSVKQIKTALVPSRAGSVELPEIQLSWWDVEAKQARKAVIPARRVDILPATGSSTALTMPPPALPPEQTRPDEHATAFPPAAAPVADAGWWPWIALSLGLMWVITLGLWLRERHRKVSTTDNHSSKASPPVVTLKHIERAFVANDQAGARAALLSWGRQNWPNSKAPKGLDALAQRLGGGTAVSILAELDRSLYAADGEKWHGGERWRQLKPLLGSQYGKQSQQATSTALPDLYPQNAR